MLLDILEYRVENNNKIVEENLFSKCGKKKANVSKNFFYKKGRKKIEKK